MPRITYSEELTEKICKRISAGETLKDILKDDNMPHRDTVWDWRRAHPEFDKMYIQAREDQAHTWADDIISIADDIQQDYLRDAKGNPAFNKNGEPVFIRESPRRTQQRIEARQWLMERNAQAHYGRYTKVDMVASLEEKDTDELLHDLREALTASGLTIENLASILNGDVPLVDE